MHVVVSCWTALRQKYLDGLSSDARDPRTEEAGADGAGALGRRTFAKGARTGTGTRRAQEVLVRDLAMGDILTIIRSRRCD